MGLAIQGGSGYNICLLLIHLSLQLVWLFQLDEVVSESERMNEL